MSNYILTCWTTGGGSHSGPCDTLPEALARLSEQHRCGELLSFDIFGAGEPEEKELEYWKFCQERAEVVTARVREKAGEQAISALPLARIYYELDTYRCHRCGKHWSGKGTLFPCAHPRKSVCSTACRGKCAIDRLAYDPRIWPNLVVAAGEAGYTVEFIGQTVQIGSPYANSRSRVVKVFPKATGYDDAVHWLCCQEREKQIQEWSERGF